MSVQSLCSRAKTFLADEAGVTAIEHRLIAGSVGLATALAFAQIGPLLQGKYQSLVDAFGSI